MPPRTTKSRLLAKPRTEKAVRSVSRRRPRTPSRSGDPGESGIPLPESPGRRSQGVATARKILDSAIRAIAASGEASLRMHEIEAETGTSKGSIYHFFGSREGLIEAAQAERYVSSLRDTLADVERVVLTSKTREQAAKRLREVYAGFGVTGRVARATRASVIGSAVSRPALARRIGEVNMEMWRVGARRIISVGMSKGFFRSDIDPMALSAWAVGMMQGRLLIETDGVDIDEKAWDRMLGDALVAVLMGIAPGR